MKTTSQTTRPLPKPVRFSLYIGAVAALCFLNWVALPAQESWMLNVSDDFMTASDTEIEFESWMLTIARDIIVEDWMTNTLLWDTAFLLAWK
jgi:hypothetical protein